MSNIPQWGTIEMVFIETSIFTRQVKALIPDEYYMEMQKFLARLPTAGDLIRGSNRTNQNTRQIGSR